MVNILKGGLLVWLILTLIPTGGAGQGRRQTIGVHAVNLIMTSIIAQQR
jgi:hypothetical protein